MADDPAGRSVLSRLVAGATGKPFLAVMVALLLALSLFFLAGGLLYVFG
ncbi:MULTISPECIES: hypothetical protein [Haloprofundus]|nr:MULTISPECIES: hypothetical protein [Haloprofundus]